MRQLEGMDKAFSICCLFASIHNGCIYIDKRTFSKWSKIRIFFELFGPPCGNPLANVDGSMPECAQVCALHTRPHLTTLRKTETVDGSRCCRRNPQNWYYVTQFLAHPVEPRERFAMGPYTCDSWIGKGSTFFRTLLICLYFNRF